MKVGEEKDKEKKLAEEVGGGNFKSCKNS